MTALERVQEAIAPYPDLKIFLFEESTHTSELAAQAVGVEVAQIAKTLMFLADGAPVLVVACGDRKINTKKLGKELNAKKVRFADADSVLRHTGFAPGGVCPFAIKEGVPVYLDESLRRFETVYPAAGDDHSAVRLTPEELYRIIPAVGWVSVAK